jgi:hypothetical protein
MPEKAEQVSITRAAHAPITPGKSAGVPGHALALKVRILDFAKPESGRATAPKSLIPRESHSNHNRHIESRIILLYVLRPVFLPELLDNQCDRFGISHRGGVELCFRTSGRNPDLPMTQQVLVPLRIRTLYWQEVEFVSFKHEPDRDRDCAPGLPADDADLDLAVAVEAVFQVVVWSLHTALDKKRAGARPALMMELPELSASTQLGSPRMPCR